MRRPRNLLGPQGMGGMVSLWGASSLIRSVQTGVIAVGAGTTSQTATIVAVTPENCVLFFTQTTQAGTGSDQRNAWVGITLTNSTTVTASINADAGYFSNANYRVVEFAPGVLKSVQRVSVTINALSTGNTAAITEVNTSKSWINILGQTMDGSLFPDPNSNWARLSFGSSTTASADRNTSAATNIVVRAQIVELF